MSRRPRSLWPILVFLVAAACGGKEGAAPDDAPPIGGGSASGTSPGPADAATDVGTLNGSNASGRHAHTPVAPSAGAFMWQSLQTAFLDETGQPCTSRVTLAVSDHATCYTSADDRMMCAGSTSGATYGSTFVPAGPQGIDQILISMATQSEFICVHQVGPNGAGGAFCMGDKNEQGQFGLGFRSTTGDIHGWSRWGGLSDIAHIGTATFDSLCAIDTSGAVKCTGLFSITLPPNQTLGAMTIPTAPPSASSGPFSSFWEDTAGFVRHDDPLVHRASDGLTECTVGDNGLSCLDTGSATLGTAGQVVMGGIVPSRTSPLARTPCWLETSGKAFCDSGAGPAQVFAGVGNILYFATHFYTSDVCAVVEDGSLWCTGPNTNGELGTGSTSPVPLPVQVQPPGSALVACE